MIDWSLVAGITGGIGATAVTIGAVLKIYIDVITIRELNLRIRALEEGQKTSEARLAKPTMEQIRSFAPIQVIGRVFRKIPDDLYPPAQLPISWIVLFLLRGSIVSFSLGVLLTLIIMFLLYVVYF